MYPFCAKHLHACVASAGVVDIVGSLSLASGKNFLGIYSFVVVISQFLSACRIVEKSILLIVGSWDGFSWARGICAFVDSLCCRDNYSRLSVCCRLAESREKRFC